MLYPVLLSLAILQDQVGDATSDPSDLFSGVGAAFVIALLLAVACVALAITWRNYRGLLKRSVRRRRRHRHHPHERTTLEAALPAPPSPATAGVEARQARNAAPVESHSP